MNGKRSSYFDPHKTPLKTETKPLADKPAEKVADTASGSKRCIDSDVSGKGSCAGGVRAREIEVEMRFDKPTEAEIKAVENFFDWLLAEALGLTGEIDQAA